MRLCSRGSRYFGSVEDSAQIEDSGREEVELTEGLSVRAF